PFRSREHTRDVRVPARHHAARTARAVGRDPGRTPAQVMDRWRLVGGDTHRPAPRRAAGLRVGRGRRIPARDQVGADLRRHHVRGRRRAPLDPVLPARVVREMHAVPGGHVLAGPHPGPAGTRRWYRGRRREAPGHLRQHQRPRVLRARRQRDAPDHLRCPLLHGRVHPAPQGGRLSVRRGGLDCLERDMTVETAKATVTVTIDGFEIAVPKGTWIIRAAEMLGIAIPRFCEHPLLEPIGACRQCLVEVEGQRKPLASCITACTEGMVVHTQRTSAVADKAQQGVMELLLINHPLDCPMCDKGGECPLQNQAMSNGRGETRFAFDKRTFDKPVPISTEVLLDRERCISCTRCTRTSEEIAGDAFIEFIGRGPSQFIGTAEGKPFNSYFSGNTVQVCPVGALTGAAYRFRSRPFDLVSVPSVCEHCAAGCQQRTDVRRGRVMRRLAGEDAAVNEEWNCDKGRWAFTYATQPDRLTAPLVRDENGVLVPASWPHALAVAAAGLLAARDADPATQAARGAGVLAGGRLTLEDAYAYAKFARVALDTNDVDMRARPHSVEEEQFLAACVAGRGIGVSYADLEQAPAVLLAGFEPEDESPIVFLRLRKAARRGGLRVFSVAALASPGLVKLSGELLDTLPGDEARALTALAAGRPPGSAPGRRAVDRGAPGPDGPGPDAVAELWQRAGQALG